MNKQEAIEKLMSKSREIIFGDDENVYLSRKRTIELVSQIDEPKKIAVPKFVDESKRLKVQTSIRPYDIGYRVVSKNGNVFALRNGASVFALPSEAKIAIQREFGKNDPSFDVEKYRVEEVAIINFEKLKNFLREVG